MAPSTVKIRSQVPIRVKVLTPTNIRASMRRILLTNAKLEDLLNVSEDTYGMEDGFIVVYDEATKSWLTRPVTTVLNEAVDLDGGIY